MVANNDSRCTNCLQEVPNGDKKENLKRSQVKTPIYIILSVIFGLLVGFALAFVLFGNNSFKEHLEGIKTGKPTKIL